MDPTSTAATPSKPHSRCCSTGFIVTGSWIGGGFMLAIMGLMARSMLHMEGHMATMADAMLSMQTHMAAMSGNMEGMSGNMARMSGYMQGMSGNMADMSENMADINWIMESMGDDIDNIDDYMAQFYKPMMNSMISMQYDMRAMTPAIMSMAPHISHMSHSMGKGVSSFTSPMNYMWNMGR